MAFHQAPQLEQVWWKGAMKLATCSEKKTLPGKRKKNLLLEQPKAFGRQAHRSNSANRKLRPQTIAPSGPTNKMDNSC